MAEVIESEWFKKGYQPPSFETAEISLDDVNAVFDESDVIFCHSVILLFLCVKR